MLKKLPSQPQLEMFKTVLASFINPLEQVKELTGGKIKKAIVDRGYKVKGGITGVDIVMPKMLKRESYYLKKKREERCRSRAGIEGLILVPLISNTTEYKNNRHK